MDHGCWRPQERRQSLKIHSPTYCKHETSKNERSGHASPYQQYHHTGTWAAARPYVYRFTKAPYPSPTAVTQRKSSESPETGEEELRLLAKNAKGMQFLTIGDYS